MPRTIEQLRHVRVADMTPEEQRLVVRHSCRKLEQEIERNRPAIEKILDEEAGGR